jgi:O-acetyl-ADP-ribose deacetylase (regulator of RNase III)
MTAQGYEEPTGQAKITPAYNLPSKYVIHTVGPIVGGHLTEKDCELLKSCYLSCLKLAEENGVKSIAFCCISTGVFSFPAEEAAETAVKTVREWLDSHDSSINKVIFNVFGDRDRRIYEEILDRDPEERS